MKWARREWSEKNYDFYFSLEIPENEITKPYMIEYVEERSSVHLNPNDDLRPE